MDLLRVVVPVVVVRWAWECGFQRCCCIVVAVIVVRRRMGHCVAALSSYCMVAIVVTHCFP